MTKRGEFSRDVFEKNFSKILTLVKVDSLLRLFPLNLFNSNPLDEKYFLKLLVMKIKRIVGCFLYLVNTLSIKN